MFQRETFGREKNHHVFFLWVFCYCDPKFQTEVPYKIFFFNTSFKNSASCPPGVRMTVLSAASVCSVTKSVSVRMEPSVITSTEPVCVKLGLKALIAKRGSVPQVSMASSVTNTAPVTAPTPWGEWDTCAAPHTSLDYLWFHKNKEFIFISALILHARHVILFLIVTFASFRISQKHL